MGMYSNFEGSVSFSRPLISQEYRAVRDAPGQDSYASMLDIDPYSFSVDTTAKGYSWFEDIKAMVAALPDDVTAKGWIQRYGVEDVVDIERVYVSGREVIKIKPRIEYDLPEGWQQ